MQIPVSKLYIPEASKKYAYDAIDSTWISPSGKYGPMAVEMLRDILGIKYVILTNSGTSALHLVSKCLAHKHPRRIKLIVPNNVYVSCWNCFIYDDNFLLLPIDSDLDTWNFNITEHENTINYWSQSILVVHNYGNIINVPDLKRRFPNVPIVEDNCEGFGGKYEGKEAGTEALCSSISFSRSKTFTTGEGGAFITNDEESYNLAYKLHNRATTSRKFIHDELGYNYEITNIAAALLCGQLENYDGLLNRKHEISQIYRNKLKDLEFVHFQKSDPNTSPSDWLFGLRIDNTPSYEVTEKFYLDNSIEVRPMFYPITVHKHLKKFINVHSPNITNATKLNNESVILPSFYEISDEELNYVVEVTKRFHDSVQQNKTV